MKKIGIIGYGYVGKGIYNFFEQYNQETMIKGFCDENYKEIREIKGRKVVGFEEAGEKTEERRRVIDVVIK